MGIENISIILSIKCLFLLGITLWFTLVVINNVIDPGTNLHLIGQMMRMDLLKEDPHMGNGIEWRAIKSPTVHKTVLVCVILLQLLAVILLWKAVIEFAMASKGPIAPVAVHHAILSADIGLGVLLAKMIWFWCGGMWYGYWVKTPQVQQVHMTLLVMLMLEFLIINTSASR